jgi:hypothetical protein
MDGEFLEQLGDFPFLKIGCIYYYYYYYLLKLQMGFNPVAVVLQ